MYSGVIPDQSPPPKVHCPKCGEGLGKWAQLDPFMSGWEVLLECITCKHVWKIENKK